MFRTLARLAEEHELLEALPFLRGGGADDEDDLIQDAIAALPPLVARFFFAPRGGPKAPPLLGRCFTLKKLSAPHDVREACLRGAANSFRLMLSTLSAAACFWSLRNHSGSVLRLTLTSFRVPLMIFRSSSGVDPLPIAFARCEKVGTTFAEFYSSMIPGC